MEYIKERMYFRGFKFLKHNFTLQIKQEGQDGPVLLTCVPDQLTPRWGHISLQGYNLNKST